MREITRYALLDSIGTALYIILIVSFMNLGVQGVLGRKETILIPIAMLMLFVFSAAFTGMLVFGRPIMWYLDGKKRQAVSLIFYTLGFFLIMAIIAILFMILLGRG